MKSKRRWIPAAVGVIWALQGGAGYAQTTSQPAADAVSLVKQLSAEQFGARDKAMRELLGQGRQAEDALREALKAPGLGREARERIGYVLDWLDTPAAGVVWRGGRDVAAPSGIEAGDVITQIANTPVDSLGVFLGLTYNMQEPRQVTVWRKGKGFLSLRAGIAGDNGFSPWPDEIELYTRYGHKGAWDKKVLDAFRMGDVDQNPTEALRGAWNDGCRDALVAAFWLWTLRLEANHKEAQRLMDELPKDLQGAYPGGEVLYGRLPAEMASLYMTMGKRQDALAVLDRAEQAIGQAQAWGVRPLLRKTRLECMLLGPTDELLKYWQGHADELLAHRADTKRLVLNLAHRMLAAGNHDQLEAFLKTLPSSPSLDPVQKYFKEQLALAKSSGTSDPKSTPVLVGLVPDLVVDAGPGGWRFERTGMAAAGAVRVDCEVRFISFPSGKSLSSGFAQLGLEGNHGEDVTFRIHRMGRPVPFSVVQYEATSQGPSVVAVYDWHKFSVERRAGMTLISLDGVPYHEVYAQRRESERLEPYRQVYNAKAEFRNLRFFVYTGAKVDSARIEELHELRRLAIKAGDLAGAQDAHDKLMALLAKAPEAAPCLPTLEREMALFKQIMSKEGLDLCSDELLALALHNRHWSSSGWELKDGWLCGRLRDEGPWAGRDNIRLRFPLPVLDSVEIIGVLDITKGSHASIGVAWRGPDFEQMTDAMFLPPGRTAGLTTPGQFNNRREEIKWVKNVDYSTPLPFCIRARGKDAVLFVRFGAKPDARLAGFVGGDCVDVGMWDAEKNTCVRFGQLRIRHLPKETPLDSPVKLPSVKAATTTSGPTTQEW